VLANLLPCWQAGEAAPPSSLLMKRQRMIIDQLKEKLNLEVRHSTSSVFII
jgi:hypothetical protein